MLRMRGGSFQGKELGSMLILRWHNLKTTYTTVPLPHRPFPEGPTNVVDVVTKEAVLHDRLLVESAREPVLDVLQSIISSRGWRRYLYKQTFVGPVQGRA